MLNIIQINRKIELKFWSVFQYLVIHYPAMKALIRWIYSVERKLSWRKTKLGKNLILLSTSFVIGMILGYFVFAI